MVIVAQIIGIVAMIINILSFQCKKNRNLFIMIGIGSLLFSANFLMLGAYASAVYNIISIIRSSLTLKKKFQNKYTFALLCVLYVAGMVFTYTNPWSIVLFVAQIVQTWAMYFKDGGVIRKSQIFFVSPIWLINNIMVNSIGGIICEAFIITSAIISYFRFRKAGFDK